MSKLAFVTILAVFLLILSSFVFAAENKSGEQCSNFYATQLEQYIKTSIKNENDISNIKQIVVGRENAAINVEESYYKSIGSVQNWILAIGGLLALILGVAVVWGIRDMQTIKKNANELAKEEANIIAKKVAVEQAQTIVGELINSLFDNKILKEIKENQDKLNAEIAYIKEEIKICKLRVEELDSTIKMRSEETMTRKAVEGADKIKFD